MKKLILFLIAPIFAFAAPTQPITNGVVPSGGTLAIQSGGALTAATAITSTVATGTAPLVVASTTLVSNLHAATSDLATNATNTAVTDDTSTNATVYPTWVTATSGNVPEKLSSTKLTFNPNTGILISTGFSGPLNGIIGGTTPAAGTFTTGVFGSTTSLLLGTAGSAVGNIGLRNATSGTVTITPPTGALGTYSVTLPNAASTLPIFGQQVTFTGPTAARSIALPDAAFTVARTDAGQTFTGVNNFTSPDITTGLTTSSTSFTALAGATTLLTIGGTGASASLFAPSTLDATSSTTGAIRTSGGISAAKAANIGTTLTVGTSVTIGSGASTAGAIVLGQGTTQSTGTTNITIQAPTSVTSYIMTLPGAVGGANTVLTDVAGNGVLSWAAAGGGTAANPTGTVGLATVNGSATTYLRSDGAPPLSQAIAPTWTGVHTFTPAARSSGVASYFVVTTPADTAQTASTESIGASFTAATRQWSTGALTTQRERVFAAPTYGFVGASTLTTAINVDIADPIAGTNATLTNKYGLRVNNQQVTGTLTANTGTNLIGPLVDSVDGTTPLNNINQVVATGTAYTMTTSSAAIDFGTTDPVLTIANAGTYAVYVTTQLSFVGTTFATPQSATFKLRRTNNTAADLTGSSFSAFLPALTTTTDTGPSVTIGPIKYTTTNTNDSVTVFGILSGSTGAGSVTASDCTITAIRMY